MKEVSVETCFFKTEKCCHFLKILNQHNAKEEKFILLNIEIKYKAVNDVF